MRQQQGKASVQSTQIINIKLQSLMWTFLPIALYQGRDVVINGLNMLQIFNYYLRAISYFYKIFDCYGL